jgi:hypothetical protein
MIETRRRRSAYGSHQQEKTVMIRCSMIAVVLTLPALAAAAQTTAPAPSASPALKAGLSLSEFQARRERAILAADTDGDGKISLPEWRAYQAERRTRGGSAQSALAKTDPAKSFARLDVNHDGFIDRSELDALFARRFARLDHNKDGVLTPDELPGHKSATNQEP